MDYLTLAIYFLALAALYIVVKFFWLPIRIFWVLLSNAILGGLVILLFNWVGAYINLQLPINPFTALVVGFLGIPGVILLIILHILYV